MWCALHSLFTNVFGIYEGKAVNNNNYYSSIVLLYYSADNIEKMRGVMIAIIFIIGAITFCFGWGHNVWTVSSKAPTVHSFCNYKQNYLKINVCEV